MISKANITGQSNLYKGYCFNESRIKSVPIEQIKWTENKSELQKENEKILNDLIDYIQSNNINVLFIIPKRQFDEDVKERLNSVIEIIEENNLKVINFNTLEDFNNIDFDNDFYNKSHLNVYGSTKFTLYLTKYLKENYELPNHKGDNKYESWDDEYIKFKQSYKNVTNKNFEELLN